MPKYLHGSGWQQDNDKQWFFSAASTQRVTLPISYSNTDYSISFGCETTSNAYGHRWCEKTLTDFRVDRISNVSTNGNFHSIGIQQWGCVALTSSTTIPFPISVNAAYMIISTAYGLQSDAHNTYAYTGISTHTNQDFKTYGASNASGRMWISIGEQQWGSLIPTKSDTTITLPVSYVSTHCVAAASIDDTTGSGGLYCANGKKLDKSNFVLAVENSGKFCSWLSLGF